MRHAERLRVQDRAADHRAELDADTDSIGIDRGLRRRRGTGPRLIDGCVATLRILIAGHRDLIEIGRVAARRKARVTACPCRLVSRWVEHTAAAAIAQVRVTLVGGRTVLRPGRSDEILNEAGAGIRGIVRMPPREISGALRQIALAACRRG